MPITLHIYNWKTKHTSWHIMTHHDISHLLDLHPHRAGHVHSTIDCSPQFLQTMKQKTYTFKTPHWMLDMDYTMNGTGLCWQLSLHTIGLFHYLWELYMKHPSFQHSHHASFHGSLFPHIIHQCPISHKDTITLSSMMPLFIHHHSHRTTLYSRHSIHNLLHNFLSMQHVLPYWTVCLFEYAPYSTFHPSMNTPSLTPSHHSNTDDAHHCTPCCIQYVCNPAHHSNTAGT